jgi:hypothetical protein
MIKFNQYIQLDEATVSVAKLRPGMAVNVTHFGRSAKIYKVDGQNVFGGKVKVLGLGVVPRSKKPTKNDVQYKDVKDFRMKNKEVLNKPDYSASGGGANAKLRKAAGQINKGQLVWIFEVIEGEKKGQIGYCYISSDDRWEVPFMNKSTEIRIES